MDAVNSQRSMPELPEVETIARALREGGRDGESILAKKIKFAEVLWERTIAAPDLTTFKRRISEQKVIQIGRRGKYLIIRLSNDTLLFHLRMSGDLVHRPNGEAVSHPRLIIHFHGNSRLFFNDPRKFGRVWLLDEPETIISSLGPEPLDELFTAHDFHQRLQTRKRQLKPLLMDQKFIAGLGNIYTDEALYLAKLHPLTPSNTLSFDQAVALRTAIQTVIQEGIRRNGASIDWVYQGGDFQDDFQVYRRTDEDCHRCGTRIERLIVGQRSTHICPSCQSL